MQRKDTTAKREKKNKGINLYKLKREIWNGYEMTTSFLFGIKV